MATGYLQDKFSIDQRIAGMVLGIRKALDEAKEVHDWISRGEITDAFLGPVAQGGVGYTTDEVSSIVRPTTTDMFNLYKRMNFKGTPSLAKTVNSGDTCTIAIGSLTGTET